MLATLFSDIVEEEGATKGGGGGKKKGGGSMQTISATHRVCCCFFLLLSYRIDCVFLGTIEQIDDQLEIYSSSLCSLYHP